VRLIIENLKNETPTFNSSDSNNFLNNFTRMVSKIPGISKFIYIGEKCIQIKEESGENAENYYEIFCRCNIGDDYPDNIELHFMINDVTRSKFHQKKKSDFQYKSLFFSKVAHELKNPLICIAELVNQIYSSQNFSDSSLEIDCTRNKGCLPLASKNLHKLYKTIGRIKAMSNYLILQVKDLEYFSQSQNNTYISIDKKETNLEEVIELCKEIGNSLLKKFNKKSAVKFEIKKSTEVPNIIFTDELRLKQVLINLISNAIKFTIYGKIKLKLNIVEDKLKFLVKDTGTGISEEKQKNIFKPFNKESDFNNVLGCGLGLSIVRDLTKKLGDDIQFKSSPSGTSFWFSIKLNTNKDNYSELQKNKLESTDVQLQSSRNNEKNSEIGYDNIPNFVLDEQETKVFDCYFNKKDFLNEISSRSFDSHYTYKLEQCKLIGSNLNSPKLSTKKNKEIIYSSNVEPKLLPITTNIDSLENSHDYNFIIVDDEKITRMSTLRMMRSSAKNLGKKINFIEANDGIECLSIFYQLLSKGVKISAVISDQNMNYLNGTCTAEIIEKICIEKNLKMFPFFLVTAIEKNIINKSILKRVINKPLIKDMAELIIKDSLY
jgi:signal transduction histidine kinase